MKTLISFLKQIISNKKNKRIIVYTILVGFVIISIIPQFIKETKPNLLNFYLIQAQAFLNVKLSVANSSELNSYELCEFNGKRYVVQQPMPVIILMPFVAIFGVEKVHVSLIGFILTIFCIFILKIIFGQLQIEEKKNTLANLCFRSWICFLVVFSSKQCSLTNFTGYCYLHVNLLF